MKVLITGSSGYIGKHVVNAFLERGHSVCAVDISHPDGDGKAEFLNIDIFSGNENIFNELGRPDLCVHLAWQDGFVHNSPRHMENLSKHFVFLRNLMAGGCKKIAVMGTMHEVGFWEGKIDEFTPCNPLSQYGIAKNALRQTMFLLAKDFDVQLYWLRAFYILGDDKRNHSIFAKILQAVDEGKTEFPFTSGMNQYDFIDVKELARQIAAASTQDEITGVINVCSGKPVALKDVVEGFIEKNQLNIRLAYGAFPDRTYDSKIVFGDAEKIQKILMEP